MHPLVRTRVARVAVNLGLGTSAYKKDRISDAPSGSAPWNASHDYTNYGFSTLEANRTMLSWKSVLDEFVMWKTA
ncbi:hypothetical protein V7S43_018274 [Phytophthora oleae]|uniref:Purple acid phosphatase C-terminal domain-containing protein n=1 Tax=Phytophthora oleae TaxID=2107226 RepID=A0ABD3ER79_9STRA